MPEKISIVKDSGETINSNIVSVFMIPDTEKKYIITTENAVDPHGLTVLHVSEIVDGALQKVATDDEWSTIKTIMRAIISGNVVSYQYLPPIETATASSQYSRDISVSASASKQMIDNYNAADKSATPAPQPEEQQPQPEPVEESAPAPVPEPTPEVTEAPVAPTSDVQTAPAPSSIFPSNDAAANEDELIPGISEINPVATEANTAPIVDPNIIQGQTFDPSNQVPLTGAPLNVQPVPGIGIDNNIDLNSFAAVPPIVGDMTNMMTPQMGDINLINGMMGLNNDVQVVNPNQIVPNGQIIQDGIAQMNGMNFSSVGMSSNVNPNFNPNATLDEVVIASQEMFMDGVRNLVQTIQEKVYRDLYAKEAELKAREDALAQKEQMIAMSTGMMNFNPGMMNMNQGMIPNNMMMQQPMNPMNQIPNNFSQQPNIGLMQQPMNQMNSMMQNGMPTTNPIVISTPNDIV